MDLHHTLQTLKLQMSDIHEQMIRAFIDYFEANQRWEVKQTHGSGIKARACLAKIRELALKRRFEIGEIRKNKSKARSILKKEKATRHKQVDVVVLPESTDNGTS